MSGSGDAFIFETLSNAIFDDSGTVAVTLNGTFEVEFNPAGTLVNVSNISLVAVSSDPNTNPSTLNSGYINQAGVPNEPGGQGLNEIAVTASSGSFPNAYLDFSGEQPTELAYDETTYKYSSIGYNNGTVSGLEGIGTAGNPGTITSTALPLAPVATDTYVLTTYNNVVFDDGSNEPVTLSGTMLTEYDPNGTLIGVSNVNLTASDPSDGGSYPSNLDVGIVNIAGTPGQTGDFGINEIKVTANGGSFQQAYIDFYGENPGTLATSPSHYSSIGYPKGLEGQTGGPDSFAGTNTDVVQNTLLTATISNVIFNGYGNPITLNGTFEEEFNGGGTLLNASNFNIFETINGTINNLTGGYVNHTGDPHAGGYAALNEVVFQSVNNGNYNNEVYLDLLGETPNAAFTGNTGSQSSSDVDGGSYEPINHSGNVGSGGVITYAQVGPDVQPATCYLRGTKLLTPAGEIAVEDLSIGDTLITRFGGYQRIKWIGRQSYAARFIRNNREQIPVRIAAGALGTNLPQRDLFVSPGHSMLIDGVLILAKNLVNGLTITQDTAPEQIDYFQPEFETHDCVMAEGAWSESYADTPGLRAQFHNAAEFYALFPYHVPVAVQQLCAPRPLVGPLLDAVLRPLILRAQTGIKPGPLRGCIDSIADGQLEGWAQDTHHPELPVLVEIGIAGRPLTTVLACDHRADLAAAGIGNGFAKFTYPLPANTALGDITVRRLADGAEIHAPSEAMRRTA